jgi:hypothetical protein
MPDSPHVAVVRRLYEARGNADIIRQVVAPDVRWEVVEGFPYGGVYVGLDDVLRNFFGRLFRDCESFVAVGSCVDPSTWQDHPAAAVRRHRSNCPCIGRVDSGGERTLGRANAHLTEVRRRRCPDRRRIGIRESGAHPQGEDSPLIEAALTDSIGHRHLGQRSPAQTASDLVVGQIESVRQAFLAVVTVMIGKTRTKQSRYPPSVARAGAGSVQHSLHFLCGARLGDDPG